MGMNDYKKTLAIASLGFFSYTRAWKYALAYVHLKYRSVCGLALRTFDKVWRHVRNN